MNSGSAFVASRSRGRGSCTGTISFTSVGECLSTTTRDEILEVVPRLRAEGRRDDLALQARPERQEEQRDRDSRRDGAEERDRDAERAPDELVRAEHDAGRHGEHDREPEAGRSSGERAGSGGVGELFGRQHCADA
jgi:hypothetical protein